MSSILCFRSGIAALMLALPSMASGDSLAVAPTRLTVPAPAQTTTLTIKAEGKGPAVLQIRVMAWKKGSDPSNLKATKMVQVSPPAAKLGNRQELTLRIVRTSNKAVRGSECYRVLIDRLPGKTKDPQAVRLQIRQSIPLCFES